MQCTFDRAERPNVQLIAVDGGKVHVLPAALARWRCVAPAPHPAPLPTRGGPHSPPPPLPPPTPTPTAPLRRGQHLLQRAAHALGVRNDHVRSAQLIDAERARGHGHGSARRRPVRRRYRAACRRSRPSARGDWARRPVRPGAGRSPAGRPGPRRLIRTRPGRPANSARSRRGPASAAPPARSCRSAAPARPRPVAQPVQAARWIPGITVSERSGGHRRA